MNAQGTDVVAVVQTAEIDMDQISHHAAVSFTFRPESIQLFDPETENNLF